MRDISRVVCITVLCVAPVVLFGTDTQSSKQYQMLSDMDAQVAFESSQVQAQESRSLAALPAGVVALQEPLPFSKPTDRIPVAMASDDRPPLLLRPVPPRPQPLPAESKPTR
jgi:hypothetical protein